MHVHLGSVGVVIAELVVGRVIVVSMAMVVDMKVAVGVGDMVADFVGFRVGRGGKLDVQA